MNAPRMTRRTLFKLAAAGTGSLAATTTAMSSPQFVAAQGAADTLEKHKTAIAQLEKLLTAAMKKKRRTRRLCRHRVQGPGGLPERLWRARSGQA